MESKDRFDSDESLVLLADSADSSHSPKVVDSACETESQHYELDESEVWKHHQLQRLRFYVIF